MYTGGKPHGAPQNRGLQQSVKLMKEINPAKMRQARMITRDPEISR
jgi:hypothetical protein